MVSAIHQQAASLGDKPSDPTTLRAAYDDLEARYNLVRTTLESTRGVITSRRIAMDVESALFTTQFPKVRAPHA